MRRNKKQKQTASGPLSGRLRIVSGKWRSRLLPVADVEGLRPTPERVRETLFNWLAPSLPGSDCLDLFAGSGALGLEALSRGARSVIFADSSPIAVKTLQNSLDTLKTTDGEVLRVDALDLLAGKPPQQFDIIFLDPPFAADLTPDLCRLLADGDWLAPGARIYLEQSLSQEIPELPDRWSLLKEKKTGNVRYSLIGIA